MRKTAAFVAVFALLLPVFVQAEAPQYTVKRTTGKIVIDGILDDADWVAAQSAGDFQFPWWKEGEKEQTEAKLLWDDKFLYLSFNCKDKHIWADHYDTNSATCLDDAAELFWNPNPDAGDKYNMFEFNCIGNVLSVFNDQKIEILKHKIIPPHIAQSIKGTVNNDSDTDTGWILEVAIRFADYPDLFNAKTPRDGDIWKIGLNRCGGKINEQYSQWSPSLTPSPNFHAPQDFGKIIFSLQAVK